MSRISHFILASLISLGTFAVVTEGLRRVAERGPVVAGMAGLLAGTAAICACRYRWGCSRAENPGPGLPAILFLSLAIDFALYVTLVIRQPLFEPKVLLGLSTIAAFAFSAAGYLRLKMRQAF